ncbi:hypothetical protein [Vreelandella titanicae]|uniref:hypothetical protein n=1 Tax=Vreelandella titanicae TaxID=664683 RepID=UPI0039BF991A
MLQIPRIKLYPVSQGVKVHGDGRLRADLNQGLEPIEQDQPPRHYFPPVEV